jgi:TatA/E family protein of Tat protein translocase
MVIAEILSETGIIIVVLAVVVLFGWKQLPKFARSVGQAQGEFKKGLSESHRTTAEPGPSAPPPQTEG